jgi:hypothetical protein
MTKTGEYIMGKTDVTDTTVNKDQIGFATKSKWEA